MEDLERLCALGLTRIALASDWEELDKAKELLASKGYVKSDDLVEDGSIPFTKADADLKDLKPVFQFPDEVPAPQYSDGKKRSGTPISESPWRNLKAFQHTHHLLPVQIPKLGPQVTNEQTIGIGMLLQPSVMFDEAQFYVKLSVENLAVGVLPRQFLKPDKFQCLGLYPDFIRIEVEPEVDDAQILCAIPILTPNELQMVAPSSVKKTSATVLRGRAGYGPAEFEVERSWNTEREVSIALTELVPVEEIGNSASFEWSILRWKNGKKYNPKKPHSVIGFASLKPPELPFRGAAASLSGFPDIIWKFAPEFRDAVIRFRVRLQVRMHLVWFLGNRFSRSIDSVSSSFQHENSWELKA